MILVGFHGTTKKSAAKILESNCFNVSTGPKQWLGDGIYFYTNIVDAFEWRGSNGKQATDAVIIAIINIPDNNVLDLSDEKESGKIQGFVDVLYDKFHDSEETLSIQEKQHTLADIIWQALPRLGALIGVFRKGERKIATLTDIRPFRQEFCLRDGRYIRQLYLVKKEDIYG